MSHAPVILISFLVAGCICGVVRETFVCTPGVAYVENQCNTCFCLGENDLVCTLNKCPQNAGKDLENCSTGMVWQEDCNKCWCTNVGTICTNKKCRS